MFVWAIADRFLDMVGLCTLLYWTVRGTYRFTQWRGRLRTEKRAEKRANSVESLH